MPTPEYHARLSPSSAHRWLNCPASIQMSKGIPPTTSTFAEAGRVAHAIGELKARKLFCAMSTRSFNSQLKKLKADEHYSTEMDGYTDTYVYTLEQHAMQLGPAPFVALETSVPIGAFTGEKKANGNLASGTADCIQIGDGMLWINDYKNGDRVPVSADNNQQMMMYALGALKLYAPVYGDTIKTVRMTIIQPALHSITDFEIPRKDLETWGRDVLIPGAAKAKSDDPGEPVPGDWCKFCPARHQCRARANQNLALEAFLPSVPAEGTKKVEKAPDGTRLLTDEEIGEILTRGAHLVEWYNSLKDYALKAALAGRKIPGHKVVAGKGSRRWTNQDKAFETLQAREVPEALLWERKPVTVAGLEKALGKKAFAEAADGLVEKLPGKPAIVPEDDKRPVYNAAIVAFGGGSDE